MRDKVDAATTKDKGATRFVPGKRKENRISRGRPAVVDDVSWVFETRRRTAKVPSPGVAREVIEKQHASPPGESPRLGFSVASRDDICSRVLLNSDGATVV